MTPLRFLILSFAAYAYVSAASASEALVSKAQASEAPVSEPPASEAIYPLVTYKCNPESDILTLTNSLLKNSEGAAYKYSDENGTYSPWDLVDIDRRTERTRIVRTKKIVKHCKLSSGEYTITIEPQVFSNNMSGACGATISSAFTVSFDGIDIHQRTPFEDYCPGKSPVITRVTVFGKTGEVKIKHLPRHKFY